MKNKTEMQSDLDELKKQLQTRQQTLLVNDGQYQFLVGRIVQLQEILGEEKKSKEEA